ncbi:flagellar hook-length control protein FliK [Saccharibacillus deserti]|uniref:flagellar hook-length control protein FliK n=1 Tax=Saccharibacillus deserti TaxID=1634444 RepID=UPI001554646E|nr:flagellar hook-length control protein FliK [Saccharibacillus deserti]
MNIGSLFKSMIGDAKPGEVKQLDLREGQVVRGVVQSVSEDGKEAVIQIQGVKVNAKLETPLRAGQTAFMQVQPAAEDGSVVMKPVAAPPGAAGGAQSMEDTLKQLALPDNKQNRELVRMMQQAEIPLTREQAADVRNLLAQKPAAVDAQQWVRSIGILQQRGLPVTPQSIAGMQQAVFGPPASAVLQNLGQQVAAVLAQLGDSAGEEPALPGRTAAGGQSGTAGLTGPAGSAPGAAAAGGQTAAAPTPGAAAAAAGSGSPAAPPAAAGAGMTAAAGQLGSEESGPAAQARAAARASAGAGTGTGEAGGPKAAAGAAGSPAAAAQAPAAAAPQAAPASAADSRAAQGTAAANGTASASPDAVLLRKVQALLGELRSAAAGSTAAAGQPPAAAAQAAPQQAPPDGAENAPWVGRLLKMLGAEHEQQAARSTLMNAAPPAAAQPAAAQSAPAAASPQPEPRAGTQPPVPAALVPTANTDTPPGISAAVRAAADQVLRGVQGENTRLGSELPSAGTVQPAGAAPAAAEVRETLKSLLLQLSASDTLPAAVKDAAQQAVQQLTGQQLLLNTDRTAPFAQVTMFLPFVGPDGNQTASVQIESRRGAKGELDASNCRLWFDLDMKALGHTVVDVQVVDRKVSLNFRNDEEWVRPLLEAGQPQIASALESAGYQLMALRTDTLPQRAESAAGASETPLSFVPSSYRGVDVKI